MSIDDFFEWRPKNVALATGWYFIRFLIISVICLIYCGFVLFPFLLGILLAHVLGHDMLIIWGLGINIFLAIAYACYHTAKSEGDKSNG